MRILLIHNRYQQPGGEDVVFEAERSLLEQMAHVVTTFVEDNAGLNGMSALKVAVDAIWSREACTKIRRLFEKSKPDVVHFHNTFLRISPAAYDICKQARIPVVQTLHNFRLLCPAATFFRNQSVCEDCLGRIIPWPGILHGCWRGKSRTAAVAAMLTVHRLLKTWHEDVDIYISLTEFARKKFIEGGLPAERIFVKPNFVMTDPLVVGNDRKSTYDGSGTTPYALFVGRLSPEKGVRTFLLAWRSLKGIPLKVVGDGPLLNEVKASIKKEGLENVEVLGRLSREGVFSVMRKSQALVFPSEWYEGFPVTIAEANACAVPVIASRLGAMEEIVDDGRTGLLFEPGSHEDLAAKIRWAWDHPIEMAQMGRNARREYELKYTPERNYEMLMDIYQRAIENHRRRSQDERA